MHLFHYHLVTSELRDVEARYVGKLGFALVARYGRVGEEHVSVEPGVSWEEGLLHTIRWYAEHRDRWIGRVDWLTPEPSKST